MIGYVMTSQWRMAQETALRWWLAFRCYLRPGENDKLTVRMLVPPSAAAGPQYLSWGLHLHPSECGGLPGKTGVYDEAVLVDSEARLGTLFTQLRAGRGLDEALWSLTAEEDIKRFALVVEALALEALAPTRYGLRHAGASEDLITKRRAALDVKRRGRWVSDSSLRRYAKETRLQSELQKVSQTVIEFGRQVTENIEQVILGEVAIALPRDLVPPSLPRRRNKLAKRPLE